MLRPFRLLLDPQGGPETGSPSPTPTATPTPTPAPDPTEGYRKLLEKHQNDVGAVAAKLYDENHSLRQKNSDLRAKVPADGSTVLDPAQASAWTKYQALGTPDDLTTIKTERDQFATDSQAAAREKLHAAAAEAHGYKAAVLSRLIGQDQLDVTVKEGPARDPKTGEPVKVAVVKHDGKETPLPDYAKAHWPDFLAALPTVPPAPRIGTPRQTGNPPPPPDGTPRKSLVY
jgi:hypothetical protein